MPRAASSQRFWAKSADLRRTGPFPGFLFRVYTSKEPTFFRVPCYDFLKSVLKKVGYLGLR